MKAAPRQRLISTMLAGAAVALALQPALAQPIALPSGLPALPTFGEPMQQDHLSGVALRGYDPVAYQAEGRAVAGRAEYELVLDGIVWRFASAANRAAFRDAPKAYIPAFSGFDPLGVSQGHAVASDPRRFAVIGARLFLFRNEESRRRFVSDSALRAAAEARWPAVSRQIAH